MPRQIDVLGGTPVAGFHEMFAPPGRPVAVTGLDVLGATPQGTVPNRPGRPGPSPAPAPAPSGKGGTPPPPPGGGKPKLQAGTVTTKPPYGPPHKRPPNPHVEAAHAALHKASDALHRAVGAVDRANLAARHVVSKTVGKGRGARILGAFAEAMGDEFVGAIAHTNGWEIVNPDSVTVIWTGGSSGSGLVRQDFDAPGFVKIIGWGMRKDSPGWSQFEADRSFDVSVDHKQIQRRVVVVYARGGVVHSAGVLQRPHGAAAHVLGATARRLSPKQSAAVRKFAEADKKRKAAVAHMVKSVEGVKKTSKDLGLAVVNQLAVRAKLSGKGKGTVVRGDVLGEGGMPWREIGDGGDFTWWHEVLGEDPLLSPEIAAALGVNRDGTPLEPGQVPGGTPGAPGAPGGTPTPGLAPDGGVLSAGDTSDLRAAADAAAQAYAEATTALAGYTPFSVDAKKAMTEAVDDLTNIRGSGAAGIVYDLSRGLPPGSIGSASYFTPEAYPTLYTFNPSMSGRSYGLVWGGNKARGAWPGEDPNSWIWVHGKNGDSGSIPDFPGQVSGVSGWWDNAGDLLPITSEPQRPGPSTNRQQVNQYSQQVGYGPIVGNPAMPDFAGMKCDASGNLGWLPGDAPTWATAPLAAAVQVTKQKADAADAAAKRAADAAAAAEAAQEKADLARQEAADTLAEKGAESQLKVATLQAQAAAQGQASADAAKQSEIDAAQIQARQQAEAWQMQQAQQQSQMDQQMQQFYLQQAQQQAGLNYQAQQFALQQAMQQGQGGGGGGGEQSPGGIDFSKFGDGYGGGFEGEGGMDGAMERASQAAEMAPTFDDLDDLASAQGDPSGGFGDGVW